jgi:Zn finger protein HypA/HybF involved in hydrogenase expression
MEHYHVSQLTTDLIVFAFESALKFTSIVNNISFTVPLHDGHATCQAVTKSKTKRKASQRTTMCQSYTRQILLTQHGIPSVTHDCYLPITHI